MSKPQGCSHAAYLYIFFHFFMKNIAKYSLPFLAVVLLAGCTGAQTSTGNTDGDSAQVPSVASSKAAEAAASSVDHHEGETNVMPHDDSQQTSSDHHEGETDVAPHGHSVSSHDDSNQPPHRH